MRLRFHIGLMLGGLMPGLLAAGCVTIEAPPNPSFKIPEQEFRQTVHTIALAPLELPPGLNNPDNVRQAFESLMEEKLADEGFTVVSSKRYQEIQSKLIEQGGGFYDIRTGKPNDDQVKAIHEKVLKELRTQWHADAILYSVFGVFKVSFSDGLATWQGAQEPIDSGSGKVTRSLAERLSLSDDTGRSGTTTAISLGVTIENMQQAEMYKKWAGIQLRAKQAADSSSRRLVELPNSELLQNEARNAAAVEFALSDLRGTGRTAGRHDMAASGRPSPSQAPAAPRSTVSR